MEFQMRHLVVAIMALILFGVLSQTEPIQGSTLEILKFANMILFICVFCIKVFLFIVDEKPKHPRL